MSVNSKKDDDKSPAWLNDENDEIHRQEVAPLLFGTGKLTLEDPDNDIEDGQSDEGYDPDETTTVSSSVARSTDNNNEMNKDYGATTTTTTTTPTETDADTQKSRKRHHWGIMKKTVKAANTTSPTPKIEVDEVSGEPLRPRRSWCLEVFYFINGCAIFACLGVVASQMLPLFMIPLNQMEPVEAVLAVYISIIAVLFMVIEWDPPIPYFRNASFLQTFLSRGFGYSFIGATCLEQAYNERVNDMMAHANDEFHIAWFSLLIQIAAWALCVVGILYFVMGLFCLKRLRDKLVKDDHAKRKAYNEAMATYRREHL